MKIQTDNNKVTDLNSIDISVNSIEPEVNWQSTQKYLMFIMERIISKINSISNIEYLLKIGLGVTYLTILAFLIVKLLA